MAKTAQEQLQESYRLMKGILSEEENQIVTDILALDEISKATLGAYIKKAADRLPGNTRDLDRAHNDHANAVSSHFQNQAAKDVNASYRKIKNRIKGIKQATNRLTKEQKELIGTVLEELEQDLKD